MFTSKLCGLRPSALSRSGSQRWKTKSGRLNCWNAIANIRFLHVHEYASMEIMANHNIPTPKFMLCDTPEKAAEAFEAFSKEGHDVLVKAQVLAGGRGKGTFMNGFKGGVHLVHSVDECKDVASKMIGQRLVTKQTGEAGKPCNSILVMEKLDIAEEKYFSIIFDRRSQGPAIIASSEGGMDIEGVASKTPEKIHTETYSIADGVTDEMVSRIATKLGFKDTSKKEAATLMSRLYNMFVDIDATQLEINPLVLTKDGRVFCSDAKINIDDNAAFRQKSLWSYRDISQEDPREIAASEYDLNYIGLEGSIGCLVNGAGLAMATMDIIKLNGGSPANFLDVGGSATTEQVRKAFEILEEDSSVKAIFVNIFGGIMRCDVIAEGVITAVKTIGLKIPVVIRLQGTNVEKAKKLIAESGISLIAEDDLDKAAAKVVEAASR